MNKKMNILKWVFRFLVLSVFILFIIGEIVLPKETLNIKGEDAGKII